MRNRAFAPVYTFFGADHYTRDIAVKTLAERVFTDDDFVDLNRAEFSLLQPDELRAAIAAAEQLPMMSARRLVIVNDVRVAATTARDTIKETDEDILAEYLGRPCEQTVLIFVADELAGNRKLAKLLLERTAAIEFAVLNDNELIKWAADEIKKNADSEADERTVRYLCSLVGNDLQRLSNEIKKLAAAALPERIITIEMIDRLVANTREIENFAFTDHIVAGKPAAALKDLRKILDDGVEPLALIGLLASTYRRLLTAKQLMQNGADRAQVASAIRMMGSKQEAFLAAARRTPTDHLVKAVERIAEADIAIKTSAGGSGRSGSRLQIEMLAAELLSVSET